MHRGYFNEKDELLFSVSSKNTEKEADFIADIHMNIEEEASNKNLKVTAYHKSKFEGNSKEIREIISYIIN